LYFLFDISFKLIIN